MTAQIVTFLPEYAPAFEALNREWIERYFVLEEKDRAVFENPYGAIIEPGGQIFFVVEDSEVRGTCAVLRDNEKVYELVKMAVSPQARGRGYGGLLIAAAIDFVRQAGGELLKLHSNSRLEPALRLYEKHGFRRVPVDTGHGYSRVDVQMELVTRTSSDS